MMKKKYLKTTSSHESDDIILMTYDSYLVVHIDDLELRVCPTHPDGGSINHCGRSVELQQNQGEYPLVT